ncbi:uncharacterized protein LOC115466575 [Microcaecilia unicolor]|uniref:Protein DP71L n=1 Tax=Microcaecilia unicolor TaxID=1415580 RepID=A0A6P7XKQ5_9AMPH|nr:uncharacterized protein LOC115466575 [Microcaecilia unicolor]
MIVDLNSFGLGSTLMNFSSHLPAAHVDGGYRIMEHVKDGASLQWVAFPVALGGHVGVITLLKMLRCLLRKALAHKWLLKTLRICWPGLADGGKNQKQLWPHKDQQLFSSPMDPAESLEDWGNTTYEGMAEMLNPHSQNLQGGEGEKGATGKHRNQRGPPHGANMSALQPSQILSIIRGPAEEEEDESDWSSESDEEEEQQLSSDNESDSAIETDRASLGSAPSNTTWSDEEDSTDSWDLDDENRTLWDSFCNNTDPYNPLSFSNLLGSQSVSTATETEVTRQGFTKTSDHLSPGIIAALPDPDIREPRAEENNLRSSSNIKKVRFSPTVMVQQMRTWTFAHRTARRGPWEEMARDRCRFKKRVAEVEAAISWCLELMHRETIWARAKEAVPS